MGIIVSKLVLVQNNAISAVDFAMEILIGTKILIIGHSHISRMEKWMNNCEHKWVFQETQQKTTVSGYEHYTAHYHRIDVYFCEKCCEIKKIEQKESVNLPFGGTHRLQIYAPIWYQPKGE